MGETWRVLGCSVAAAGRVRHAMSEDREEMRSAPFAPQQPQATPARLAFLHPIPDPFALFHLVHVANLITPHNTRHVEWGLFGLCKDVANKKNKDDPSRGGGGAALRLSLSFNSFPHLKIFSANGPPPLYASACYAACTRPSSLCLAGYAHTRLTPLHRLATHASGLLVERTWAYCPCV